MGPVVALSLMASHSWLPSPEWPVTFAPPVPETESSWKGTLMAPLALPSTLLALAVTVKVASVTAAVEPGRLNTSARVAAA